MPRRLPKFCCEWINRHGKPQVYLRRLGHPKVRLHGTPWTPEFMEEYERALNGAVVDTGRRKQRNGTAGSWQWLCQHYFRCAEFLRLEKRTQVVRRRILELTFDEPIAPGSSVLYADFPVARMTRKAIKVLRDRKIDTPSAANERLKAIRQVFAYGIEDQEQYVPRDPSREVRFFEVKSLGIHTWSRDEVAQYLEQHPPGSQAYLALMLLLYTGVRRSDLVRLGHNMINGGWLTYQARKTRLKTPEPLRIPILPALAAALPTSQQGTTFLVTELGRPFSAEGFGNKFKRWCVQAGLEHCSAHGLRKAGATFAAENGATESQLRAMFGWSSAKMPSLYTRKAQQKVLAGAGMGFIDPS